MRSSIQLALVIALVGATAPAPSMAQPRNPPSGPADVIRQAGSRRADVPEVPDQAPPEVEPGPREPTARDLPPGQLAPGQQLPPGHPPTAGGGGMGGGGGPGQQIASAEPSPQVAAGTIRVTVIDAQDRPVSNADVNVGLMGQEGRRDRRVGRTGADGTYAFTGLGTGSGQAYRVNVPYNGATYSCTPFQLPPDQGYDVRIKRLPTTRDATSVLLEVGQVFIELRDDRLHVTQQMQVANVGQATYLLPTEGKLVRLPEGFLAFQTEPVMTDQRLTPSTDTGFRIFGSIPPGRVELAWAFDLSLHSSSEMRFTAPVPFKAFTFQVIAEAPPGLQLQIDGMPEPHTFEDGGRSLLGSGVQFTRGDPPFNQAVITISGIPGPGPARWVAVILALIVAVLGVTFGLTGGARAQSAATARAQRKQELLDEAVELEELHAVGDVGPKFKARRTEAIVAELSLILREDAAAAAPPASKHEG